MSSPPKGDQWLHEIKFDGYRLIAFIHNNKVKLITRGQQDWTTKFANVRDALLNLSLGNAILDGEVVVLNAQHHSDFQLLQNAMKEDNSSHFIYNVFDVMYYDNLSLVETPLIERKRLLQQLLPNNDDTLVYSDHVEGNGEAVFQKAKELNLEGIISKERDSCYEQQRTRSWLKTKTIKRQEFVIGGFTRPKGLRKHFGSLLLGVYEDGNFIYCGNVGTGFTQASLKEMYQLLEKNVTDKMPFTVRPVLKNRATWVKPVIVGEVEFTEWTKDGILRHPSFKGVRKDKSAKKVIKEMPKSTKAVVKKKVRKVSKKNNVKNKVAENLFGLSNPTKILYPEAGITKNDLANYYDAVSEWMLPYVCKRPLSLVRCPGGWEHCFYQKHLSEQIPDGLFTVPIKEKTKKADYLYVKNKMGLLALVQLGVLEIHPWGSRIDNIEKPDFVTFDLDPATNVSWREVVNAAFLVKDQLERLNLESFLKTTGGKGLHIVVPIKRHYEWEDVKAFTKAFVEHIAQSKPKLFLTKMNKAQRVGKIFLDYLRNGRGATAVGAYSTRARAYAPVSCPIGWNELTMQLKSNSFTIENVVERLKKLKKDPWEDFFKVKQSIKV